VVVKEGGIACLKNSWDSASTVHSLEVAVELLRNLASSLPIAEVLASDGFIQRLVGMLNCGVSIIKTCGCVELMNMMKMKMKIKKN